MAALRHPAAPLPALLLLLLSWSLTCHASPLVSLGASSAATDPSSDPTAGPTETPTESTEPTVEPTTPTTTEAPKLIDVQEQIYIITGVFIFFIIFLLAVSLGTAYVVIGMRQTMKALQAGGAGLASKAAKAQRQPSRRKPSPSQAQPLQRDNRAFAPDDDDDYRGGDELQSRGFDQYPDLSRNEPPRTGRQLSSPSHVSEPQAYDRFHQPLPDAHMPSERARPDNGSRYGAGNLARLPKGPAPQPSGYDSRYPDDRDRRSRSPGRSQW